MKSVLWTHRALTYGRLTVLLLSSELLWALAIGWPRFGVLVQYGRETHTLEVHGGRKGK